jgi:predicted RNA-binding protein with PUA-like domain
LTDTFNNIKPYQNNQSTNFNKVIYKIMGAKLPNKISFWIVKQEPTQYSWQQFEKDGGTYWDGVRNYQARNNLKVMKKGDMVLFYHSVIGKEIVGIAKVTREAYQDPTTDDKRWVVVDLKPIKSFKISVTLEDIKSHKELSEIALIKQSRLSVMPLAKKEFHFLLKIGKTTMPK